MSARLLAPRRPTPSGTLLPALLLGAAIVLAGLWGGPPPASAQEAVANPTLRQVWLTAGIHRIRAEVAATPAERSRGLMMRQALAPNHGMLFVFETVSTPCFWMKNTLIPLTIAFIADDGEIVTLADMQPHDESSHCPARPVRYALELEQGWFRTKGIRTGDRIGGL